MRRNSFTKYFDAFKKLSNDNIQKSIRNLFFNTFKFKGDNRLFPIYEPKC